PPKPSHWYASSPSASRLLLDTDPKPATLQLETYRRNRIPRRPVRRSRGIVCQSPLVRRAEASSLSLATHRLRVSPKRFVHPWPHQPLASSARRPPRTPTPR